MREREEERAMKERKRWSAQPSSATEPVIVVHGGSGTYDDTSFSVSPMWFRQIDDVAEMVEVFRFGSSSGLIRLGVVHFRSVFGSCDGVCETRVLTCIFCVNYCHLSDNVL
ncbi:hypothetical protein HanIR_Chr03g0119401 [Helianthus annuus]|nr:hypothetical protein HanIR_Chr03g0119401 [Helianthus annuus]